MHPLFAKRMHPSAGRGGARKLPGCFQTALVYYSQTATFVNVRSCGFCCCSKTNSWLKLNNAEETNCAIILASSTCKRRTNAETNGCLAKTNDFVTYSALRHVHIYNRQKHKYTLYL